MSIQAFILAAGKGSRLGDLTNNSPKCLLDIDGRTLLARSLDNIARSGIESVSIVTGYRAERIAEFLNDTPPPVPVRLVDNPLFDTTGSVLSLYYAARADQAGADRTIVLESDLLYHPGFLAAALERSDDVLLVADRSGSGDEVYVGAGDDNRITFLGKSVPAALRDRAAGEFAGITALSRAALAAYADAAEVLLAADNVQGHYEELLFAMSQDDRLPLSVLHCPGLPWTEVDNAADLDRARTLVLPRLAP